MVDEIFIIYGVRGLFHIAVIRADDSVFVRREMNIEDLFSICTEMTFAYYEKFSEKAQLRN